MVIVLNIGIVVRADLFLSSARTYAGELLEEASAEAAGAYLALSTNYPFFDRKNTLYMGLAHIIAKSVCSSRLLESTTALVVVVLGVQK